MSGSFGDLLPGLSLVTDGAEAWMRSPCVTFPRMADSSLGDDEKLEGGMDGWICPLILPRFLGRVVVLRLPACPLLACREI